MDAKITGLLGNESRNANFTIDVLAAEILEKQTYLGTMILREPWVGLGTTLQVVVTTTDADGATNASDDTYTALLNQPLRDFLNAAMVQYQAAIVDCDISYTESSINLFTVNINAETEDGTFADAPAIQTVSVDTVVLVFAAVE